MSEDEEKARDKNTPRANVKVIFLTNTLQVALNKFCGRLEIMEKPAMLLCLSDALHASGDLPDARHAKLHAKYGFSEVKRQDGQLAAEAKAAEESAGAEKKKRLDEYVTRKWGEWLRTPEGQTWSSSPDSSPDDKAKRRGFMEEFSKKAEAEFEAEHAEDGAET